MEVQEIRTFIVKSIMSGYELKTYKSGENYVIIAQILKGKTEYAICVDLDVFIRLDNACTHCMFC